MGHPTIPTVPSILLVVVPILIPILGVIPVLVLVRIRLVRLSRPGDGVLLGGPSHAIHFTHGEPRRRSRQPPATPDEALPREGHPVREEEGGGPTDP